MWKHFEKCYKCTNVGHQHKRIQPDLTGVHSFTVQSTNTLSTCISKTRYHARPPRYKGNRRSLLFCCSSTIHGFPGGSVVKNPPANAEDSGDAGSIPGSGRSPGKGNGNLLQYSCLENPMDRGAWWGTVRRVAKSFTQLSTQLSQASRPVLPTSGFLF